MTQQETDTAIAAIQSQLNEIANALDEVQETLAALQDQQEEVIERLVEIGADSRGGFSTIES